MLCCIVSSEKKTVGYSYVLYLPISQWGSFLKRKPRFCFYIFNFNFYSTIVCCHHMFVGNFLLCHSSADICEKSSGCVPHSRYFTMWILSRKCELLFGENTMTKSLKWWENNISFKFNAEIIYYKIILRIVWIIGENIWIFVTSIAKLYHYYYCFKIQLKSECCNLVCFEP